MKEWQNSYLNFFHVLVRVVGCIFIVVGSILALCFIILCCQRKTDSFTAGVSIAAGLVCALLGVLLNKAKPSRPTKVFK